MNTVSKYAKRILAPFVRFIFKNECAICQNLSPQNICHNCTAGLTIFHGDRCSICSRGIKIHDKDAICISCQKERPIYQKSVSYCVYDAISAKITKDFKYRGKRQMGKFMAKCMVESLKDIPEIADINIIMPVPMHHLRLMKRTYNQAAILACNIASEISLPLDFTTLKRKNLPACNQ